MHGNLLVQFLSRFKFCYESSCYLIFNFLQELAGENKLIIVIHHDLGDVLQYFDELILLNRIIVAQGNCAAVLDSKMLTLAYREEP